MVSTVIKGELGLQFMVSIDLADDNNHVNVFIHGIATQSDFSNHTIPYIYREHTAFNIEKDFDTIFEAVKYGIEYHYRWNTNSKNKFADWLESELHNGTFF
jgi:hypothetical protein